MKENLRPELTKQDTLVLNRRLLRTLIHPKLSFGAMQYLLEAIARQAHWKIGLNEECVR